MAQTKIKTKQVRNKSIYKKGILERFIWTTIYIRECLFYWL